MRKVFTPPSTGGGSIRAWLGGLVLTLVVFLVLPLTQMISARKDKMVNLAKVTGTLPPPPDAPPPPPPPPPPPEEKQEPPKPDLQMEARPLSLDQLSLDLAVGEGGAFLSGLDSVMQQAAETTQDTIFGLADLDNRPQPMVQVAPVHPRDLLKARVEGQVVLLFVVGEDGRVEEPRVETSSRPEFEKPALEAVRKWKFKPGNKDGKAVKTYLRQPIRFAISS